MLEHKSELKIGIILNYVNMGIGNLIPIFYTPVMLSLLGQNEYGLYKLSSSVTGYLGLISLGIGAAVTRYLIKAKTEEGQEAEERMLGLFLLIFRFIAVVAFIFGLILIVNLDIWYADSLNADEMRRMQILVFLMVCNMSLSFSMSPYLSIVTAREKYIFYQWMSILNTCIVPILSLVALYMGYASIGLAVVSLAVAFVVRVVYSIYVTKSLGITPRYKNLPLHCLKEIMMFSFWIFVGNVVGQLYNTTDTLMIGAIPALATVAVAVYNIGNTFNSIILGITTGLSNLLVPRTNRMVFSGATNEELTDYSILVGRLQCYVLSFFVAGFVLFGKPFIHFYVGDGYLDAYWVALCVIIPNMIPLVQSVCLSIVVAKNQHRFRSLMYLGIAILNVIGTWFVLHEWGIIGAAFVTGLALIVGNGFVMNWYYWKKTGLMIGRFWLQVLKVSLIPVVLCVLFIPLVYIFDFYNVWNLIAGIVFFSVLMIMLQWKFSMNSYERDLCRQPFVKLRMVKERKILHE